MTISSTALLERLVQSGQIRREQVEGLHQQADARGEPIEDALVEQGLLSEQELLSCLAALHGTRFMGTAELAQTSPEPSAVRRVPRALAERLCVCPLRSTSDEAALVVVAAAPGDETMLRELREQAGVASVEALAARPAAVRAAIARHYAGDVHAFAKLDREGYDAFKDMLDVYERNLFTEESLAQPASDGAIAHEQELTAAELTRAQPLVRATLADAREGPSQVAAVELANVLVSLLENQRAELRGHSAQVARLLLHVGEHMGLGGEDIFGLRLSGLLHDVGKTSSYHLTALNVAEYEGHRAQASKAYLTPCRLFEAAALPRICSDAWQYMYERYDGTGFPDGRAGQDIPLSARLLAIAETYADLTTNARNPFRQRLAPKAAMEVLGRYKGRIFDSNLVDLFQVAALGQDLRSKLIGERPCVMLVDSDAEETTVLELRLIEQGCDVILCRNADDAYEHATRTHLDAMLVETDVKPHGGFHLVERVRASPSGADVPVLFLTRRADRASVDRGFALGAVDYIVKPAAANVVVAKTRNALSRETGTRGRSKGVRGALTEMPLPDVLQVLSRTRKTGRLSVSAYGHTGEIHFCDGEIHAATYMKQRGEEAVYAMLQLVEGSFSLDPDFKPELRDIHAATETLLLEAMRRWDEAQHDLGATRVE